MVNLVAAKHQVEQDKLKVEEEVWQLKRTKAEARMISIANVSQ